MQGEMFNLTCLTRVSFISVDSFETRNPALYIYENRWQQV